MRDKWSNMGKKELKLELKKITSEKVILYHHFYYSEWEEREMRKLLRFLYSNLKEEYIQSIKLLDKIENEKTF